MIYNIKCRYLSDNVVGCIFLICSEDLSDEAGEGNRQGNVMFVIMAIAN